MALTFSEGSIGGDIERVNLRELEAFYGGAGATAAADAPSAVGVASVDEVLEAQLARVGETWMEEPSGSNGFAIAPKNTADGHALLWINPHTSFFFREELQMSSDEGLNAYGAVTSAVATLTVDAADSAFVSDDFSSGTLNPGLWTFVNPLGDSTAVVVGQVLQELMQQQPLQEMEATELHLQLLDQA